MIFFKKYKVLDIISINIYTKQNIVVTYYHARYKTLTVPLIKKHSFEITI